MPVARAQVNGEWQADVTYDWPDARYAERFAFAGEAGELHGSASFLGVARGVLEGRVDAAGLGFVARTSESGAPAAVAPRSCIATVPDWPATSFASSCKPRAAAPRTWRSSSWRGG